VTTIIPKVALVVARGRNGVIGAEGDLPWRLPSDLRQFKAHTLGKPVIMGRKTWETLPFKPLPGRANIVVTRQAGYRAEGAFVAGDLGEAFDEAFMRADMEKIGEVCVIGGAQIYAATIGQADLLYLTEVEAEPEGEARFPDFDEGDWREVRREAFEAGPQDDCGFTFRLLERVRQRD
jgi:dihydrofolate reductase